MYTKETLIEFENDIANCFNNKMIKAPIHLHEGNEEQLLEIFKMINEDDWVFTTWRSHYHCLLKGVPKELLKSDILQCKSITLCYEKYKIFSSAIVTGNIPIATGVAMDIKRNKKSGKVWLFSGDMTSTTGMFYENYRYATMHDLPMNFVIEDNDKSVCTITKDTWNGSPFINSNDYEADKVHKINENLFYYSYKMVKYQHAGTGVRVQF